MKLPYLAPRSLSLRGFYHIFISLVCGYLGLIVPDNAVFVMLAGSAMMNVVIGLDLLSHDNTFSGHA